MPRLPLVAAPRRARADPDLGSHGPPSRTPCFSFALSKDWKGTRIKLLAKATFLSSPGPQSKEFLIFWLRRRMLEQQSSKAKR